jgi:hypothetical protein
VNWFKAWHVGILRGSLSDTDDSTQLIWIKMLAITSETRKRDGRLEFSKGRPMPPEYLASYMNTTMEKFIKALKKFVTDIDENGIPRITIEQDGTIVINKWFYYQKDKKENNTKEPMPQSQKLGMTRNLVNQNPQEAIDTLCRDFGYTVIDQFGELKTKENTPIPQKRKAGRPKGSKNKIMGK